MIMGNAISENESKSRYACLDNFFTNSDLTVYKPQLKFGATYK